ncbi:MAG: prolipoprotein diacylglyceryl transferase [Planctomycetia bacterium]|nr:prolipoprotein diacylglyceryl transferase [Planctomycetia bacterium]
MRQTLFYLPTQIGGLPLFGVGILFWAILIVGILTLIRDLCVHARLKDTPFHAFATFIGLFIVNYLGPRIAEVKGFPIRGYGVMLTLAIVVSATLVIWRGRKKWNYPVETLLTIIFVAVFFGLFGARVFYVAQYWTDFQLDNLRETLINIADIANGGLVVYGSVIGGIIAVFTYLLVKRLPLRGTLDLFAPSLMLGIAIGRLGCFLNGCCFGGVCDLPWAVTFPQDSPAYHQQVQEGVISLFGITLEPPFNPSECCEEEEHTLFHLKHKHNDLATELPSPVIIAKVDPDSEAQKAGVAPGDRICEIGLTPRPTGNDDKNETTSLNTRLIQRYPAESNAMIFYFFCYKWDPQSNFDVVMTLQRPQLQLESTEEKTDALTSPEEGVDATDVATPENSTYLTVQFHPTAATAKPVHPTQIYSSLSALTICVILLLLSRFTAKDGVVFGCMLILYPCARFCLELVRTDEESFHGAGLTVSQCVSVFILLVGVTFLVYSLWKAPKLPIKGFFPEIQSREKKTEGQNA